MKKHREMCHHKDEPGDHYAHDNSPQCRCICTCPEILKIHQFYAKYANTPLEFRHVPIITSRSLDTVHYTNLNEVYVKLHETESEGLQESLISDVQDFLLEHTLSK